jgi:SagB-type dehydrogenase family enzyme
VRTCGPPHRIVAKQPTKRKAFWEGRGMADGDMARLFHRLTSMDAARVPNWDALMDLDDPWIVTSFEPNDLDVNPALFKAFPAGLPVLPLPRELPAPEGSTLAVLGGDEAAGAAAFDLAQLARLLHLSAGIVRTEERSGGRTYPFRAAGSAGGRFPLEVYVVVPEGAAGLPPGVHAYRPVEHDLVQVGPPPAGAATALVVTGVPWRTGWRYRERGYRHIFWDAGTMLSQQLAVAASAGLPARLYTEFPDMEVRDLVGADGIAEFPVAVLTLDDAPPGWTPGERGAEGSVDESPVHFPLVTATHWAGVSSRWGEPWEPGDAVRDLPDSPPVNDVIYRRGSTRRMDASRGLPREALDSALAVSLRGIDLPHFVAAHDVEGVPPGLYRWPDLTEPVRGGNLRAELHRIAAGQGLAGDAAFVVITAADITSISDRRYRELQLAAGLVEGRLHLAAFALGYGASGMTFLDSEIPALVRDDLEAMLFTCVGVPEYTNKPGGPPGEPVRGRRVVARVDD